MDAIQSSTESLARFQRIRQEAQARQTSIGQDPRSRLADIIGKKKLQEASPGVTRPGPARGSESSLGVDLVGKSLRKAGELLLYNRDTGIQKELPGTKILGNYVDLVG